MHGSWLGTIASSVHKPTSIQGMAMNSREHVAITTPSRFPKSLSWLQLYVDIFLSKHSQHCKGLAVVVCHDPSRRNGCNWHLAVSFVDGKAECQSACLQQTEEDFRVLFAVFDLEIQEKAPLSRPRIWLRTAPA
jgi:hypothetical protein